jgi:hypothetical protein
MNYGKQGLKVLGVSLLAAFGLMALGASGAAASGAFLIEGYRAYGKRRSKEKGRTS